MHQMLSDWSKRGAGKYRNAGWRKWSANWQTLDDEYLHKCERYKFKSITTITGKITISNDSNPSICHEASFSNQRTTTNQEDVDIKRRVPVTTQTNPNEGKIQKNVKNFKKVGKIAVVTD